MMLDSDPTLRSERQLQRFLRKLEPPGFLTTTVTRIFIHLVHSQLEFMDYQKRTNIQIAIHFPLSHFVPLSLASPALEHLIIVW